MFKQEQVISVQELRAFRSKMDNMEIDELETVRFNIERSEDNIAVATVSWTSNKLLRYIPIWEGAGSSRDFTEVGSVFVSIWMDACHLKRLRAMVDWENSIEKPVV